MAPKTTAKSVKTVKGLRVMAKRDGFRRAGYAFSHEPTDIPLSDLNKAQIEQIKGDKSLLCVEVDIEVADDAIEGAE